MTNKVWKRTPILPAWRFQHINSPPFRGIQAECITRGLLPWNVEAYAHDPNPGKGLYYLVDDILNFINTEEACAEFGARDDHNLTYLGRSADQSTAINRQVFWIPIDDPDNPCPLNTKVQLINKIDGNALYGIYTPGDKRWTHWQGAPVFKD